MSGLRCWPGCLAQVIGGDDPALIGRVFTVTERCKVHPDSWDTDPPAHVSWAPEVAASLHDSTLLPLTPPPGTDTTAEPVSEPVVETVGG